MRGARRVALASILVASSVRAQTTPSDADAPPLPSLSVHRTDDTLGCPDARALAAIVDRQMKRSSVTPSAGPASLEVQIYKSEEGFTAVIVAGEKTRQLAEKGKTCAGLAEALGITIAILLDSGIELPPPPVAPPEPPPLKPNPPPILPAVAPPPSLEPEEPPPPIEPPVEARTWSIGLASGAALAGLTTAAAPGWLGAVEARTSKDLAFDLGVLYLPPRGIAFGTGHVDVSLTATFIRASVTLVGSPTKLASAGVYAMPILGAMQGTGVDYVPSRTQSRPWFALAGGVEACGNFLGPIGYFAHAGIVVPFTRESFFVGDAATSGDVALETPALGGSVDAGVKVTIF